MVWSYVVPLEGPALTGRGEWMQGRFAWQGLEIDVPEDWELGAFHGNGVTGYAALDDGVDVRLQVRWNRRGGRVSLPRAVAQYRRSLRKKTKKRIAFEELAPEFLPMRCRKGRAIAPFHWEGDRAAYGCAWQCAACNCVGLIELLFPVGQADRKAAQRILTSVRDHREDDQRLWSVYGFAFVTPAAYNLERSVLTPGKLQFVLRASKLGRVRVERWSMASEWLKKAPLEKWPRELAAQAKSESPGRFEQRVGHVHGHPALCFRQEGGRKGLVRRPSLEGLLWCCAENDTIYTVVAQGAEDGLPDTVAATIGCH